MKPASAERRRVPRRTKGRSSASSAFEARRPGRRGTRPSTRLRRARAAAEPPLPGSARATIRTPENAEDIKQKVRDLHAALSQIKALRKNLPKTFYDIGVGPQGHPVAPPLRGQALPLLRVVRRARDRPREDDGPAPRSRGRPLHQGRRPRGRHGPGLRRHHRDRHRGRARARAHPAGPRLCHDALPLRPPGRLREGTGREASLLHRVRGRVTVTFVPTPRSLWMRTSPWCWSTILRTIERPRPVPASLVVKNGSKT